MVNITKFTFALSFIATIVLLVPNGTSAGLLDYNLMSCMDFSRHMVSTVPSRIGLFRRADMTASLSKIPPEKRGIVSSLVGGFQTLLGTVTNAGDQNVINCISSEPFSMCLSIDSFLEQAFPGWFFEYQVTHNFNHIVSQVTQSPYHALFEAGLKAYSCFCAC